MLTSFSENWMPRPRFAVAALLVGACWVPCVAQTGATVYELTENTFLTAAQQPVTWLLQVNSGGAPALALSEHIRQIGEYYNTAQTSKGVRVGKVACCVRASSSLPGCCLR